MHKRMRLAALSVVSATVMVGCGTTALPEEQAGGPAAAGSQVDYTPGPPVKPSDGKTLRIGASFPILDQFLQKVADGITTRAAQSGATASIVSAQERTDVQLGQIENFISQKVDGLIVLPQDTDATSQITTKAKAAGIPLVYVNRRPADIPADVPYVGSDSLVAGKLQMEALGKLVNNTGNVAILQGDPGQEAARQRTKGCEDTANELGMKVTRKAAGNWYRDKGLSITENWLQSGDQIDVICSNNDEMALGAIQALRAAGKLNQIKVGGVDATADALAAMKAGALPVTVFQDAKGQGFGGVDTIVRLYNKEEVPSFVNVPYQLVTPQNMNDFVGR